MKEIIANINKAFENRTRLGIMSALMVNEWIDFSTLKRLLDTTDGNLSSNVANLEKLKYVRVRKRFIGRKSNTSYSATRAGRKAFRDHLAALEVLIKDVSN